MERSVDYVSAEVKSFRKMCSEFNASPHTINVEGNDYVFSKHKQSGLLAVAKERIVAITKFQKTEQSSDTCSEEKNIYVYN